VRYENRLLGTMGLNIGEAPGAGNGKREARNERPGV
jgi:hypothetical protein